MKINNFHFTLLLLLVVISSSFFASCKKEDIVDVNNNNYNPLEPTENTLSAGIDGVEWIADVATINGTYDQTANIQSLIINGVKHDGSLFKLTINFWNEQIGTFYTYVAATTNYVTFTYQDVFGDSYKAPEVGIAIAQGILKIFYCDGKKVSGSFSFTGGLFGTNETIAITDGIFSCINVQ